MIVRILAARVFVVEKPAHKRRGCLVILDVMADRISRTAMPLVGERSWLKFEIHRNAGFFGKPLRQGDAQHEPLRVKFPTGAMKRSIRELPFERFVVQDHHQIDIAPIWPLK
ncbi:hypothetical protein D3C87_1911280 [compost metagenome]